MACRTNHPDEICLRGHKRIPENVIFVGRCRICNDERTRRYLANRKKKKSAQSPDSA